MLKLANLRGLKSFFAMPLLDWQAPSDASIISHRFWIYWAVTVPLTATVLLLWSTWYLLQGGQRAKSRTSLEKGLKDRRHMPEAVKMGMFTILGLDGIRGKLRRPFSDNIV